MRHSCWMMLDAVGRFYIASRKESKSGFVGIVSARTEQIHDMQMAID